MWVIIFDLPKFWCMFRPFHLYSTKNSYRTLPTTLQNWSNSSKVASLSFARWHFPPTLVGYWNKWAIRFFHQPPKDWSYRDKNWNPMTSRTRTFLKYLPLLKHWKVQNIYYLSQCYRSVAVMYSDIEMIAFNW